VIDEVLDRVLVLFHRGRLRDRQFEAMAVGLGDAVFARDRQVLADDGLLGALVHRDLGVTDVVENAEGVVRAVLDLDVAVHGGTGQQVEIRMQRGQHDGDGVIGAGVHVEDELARGHSRFSVGSGSNSSPSSCVP